MTTDTFDIIVQPDGTEILIQMTDEIDKNHGPDDTVKTNNAKVFTTNGKSIRKSKCLIKLTTIIA